ncbi:hypothetical protein AG1IA_01785 [Rhizoctonia solani AG-1 IA]|uniref:MFS_1 domain-containing protein n=1 Tax=Thanatephorus cucumeris (strain AG1-IA) TaxID=983506 RepID=L8X1S4_THACA|nr:hypothetical protein AG1IA_01785 [Rhizoctonia solani AG-1 IA]
MYGGASGRLDSDHDCLRPLSPLCTCFSVPTLLALMPTSQNSDRTVDARPQGHESQTDPESPQQPVRQTPVPKLQLLTVCVSRIAEPFAYTQVGFHSLTSCRRGADTLSPSFSRRSFWSVILIHSHDGCADGWWVESFQPCDTMTDLVFSRPPFRLYSRTPFDLGRDHGRYEPSSCPLVGGALANPNESIPHLVPAFLHGLFDKYPYMLPSMAACTVAAMSFAFVFIFLEETLPSMVRRKARKRSGASTPTSLYGARGRTLERTGQYSGSEQSAESSSSASPSTEHSRYSSASTRVGEDELPKKCPSETDALLATADDEDEDEQPHNWTVRELLKLPELRQLYRSSMILSFIPPVISAYSPCSKIQYGGLGFEPAEIGFVLATAGGISFALQILVLPVILRRAKPTKTFEACMMLWPIGFAIPPILNIIARTASENGKHPIGPAASAAIWVGIWGAQLITKLACMGYAMNMVIARQSAPDQRALGTTNGLNQLFMCIARMFAPAAVSKKQGAMERDTRIYLVYEQALTSRGTRSENPAQLTREDELWGWRMTSSHVLCFGINLGRRNCEPPTV